MAQLIVNDGAAGSVPDSVIVTTDNVAPVANAGPNQLGLDPGARITLNGSASFDANGDPITYAWTLVSKPAGSVAILTSPTTISSTFTVDRAGSYVAQLIVNDGTVDSLPDSLLITTPNVAPVANAGPDQLSLTPGSITLDGRGSSDANGDPITYAWTFVSKPAGSTATLINSASASPTFEADLAGSYEVQLIVNDDTVNSDPDSVIITIN